jgi:murein DD-endopeptidase MepM/ murein hydrolase activator NlpD
MAATAQTSEDEAERAATEIQEARDQANAAAQAFLDAQSELETLEDEVVQLELEAEQLEATVADLREDVESVALARFIGAGTSGIPLLTALQDPQAQVQAAVFVNLLTNTGNDVLDQYDVARNELAQTRDALADRRADTENQQEVFSRLQSDAEAEVEHLREVEAQRLNDEAVRKALEAKLAAERARAEEAQRAAAEAAAREVPNPGAAPAAQESSAAASDPVANSGSDSESGSDSGSTSDSESGSDSGSTSDSTPPSTSPPAPPINAGSSGGTSGGRTGASGGGSTPAPIPASPTIVGGLACPMPGSAYGDTWGASRSGGRRHEGVDMLAPSGTPIFAVTSGYATFKGTRLGGNSVSLSGDDGTRYFYAHLSGFEGSSRRVAQGEVIGYNGDTGNARGVPHLHFEVHPGGGSAINPTPTVRAAGC